MACVYPWSQRLESEMARARTTSALVAGTSKSRKLTSLSSGVFDRSTLLTGDLERVLERERDGDLGMSSSGEDM